MLPLPVMALLPPSPWNLLKVAVAADVRRAGATKAGGVISVVEVRAGNHSIERSVSLPTVVLPVTIPAAMSTLMPAVTSLSLL